MKRIDVTDQWQTLSREPMAMQQFVLDYYGADHFLLAPWPYAALYKGDQQLGLVSTEGYPRIVTEDDRIYMELADLEGIGI